MEIAIIMTWLEGHNKEGEHTMNEVWQKDTLLNQIRPN